MVVFPFLQSEQVIKTYYYIVLVAVSARDQKAIIIHRLGRILTLCIY